METAGDDPSREGEGCRIEVPGGPERPIVDRVHLVHDLDVCAVRERRICERVDAHGDLCVFKRGSEYPLDAAHANEKQEVSCVHLLIELALDVDRRSERLNRQNEVWVLVVDTDALIGIDTGSMICVVAVQKERASWQRLASIDVKTVNSRGPRRSGARVNDVARDDVVVGAAQITHSGNAGDATRTGVPAGTAVLCVSPCVDAGARAEGPSART